ncbi:MAG: DUF559 domain-containing protein [Syntrophobacteraceae bacterium]|nr:DUF559 domain-containing protein [Syntrophobacteraceae bacterium]
MLPYSNSLKPFARELRKRMTDAEQALWSKVRRKQLNGRVFYPQKAIGSYIVDFYCPSVKLVVELDGGQHYTDEGRVKDQIGDKVLANLGLSVLRFSDLDILKNMDGVLSVLYEQTRNPPSPPTHSDHLSCPLHTLVCARPYADDPGEKGLAGQTLRSKSIRVVLHLEQPTRNSKLFPRAIDPAAIQQKLKQLLKAIDAHPKV